MAGSKKTGTGGRSGKAEAARHFSIVGVGASAGGLEAFTALLKGLAKDTGMAFVLVQHLDPEHESALAQILSRATSLPVHEITDEQRVEPNNVYVIPRDAGLSIAHGVLKVTKREKKGLHRPIDAFFESLAADQGENAIGVVLSGTATDGTLGLEAIKAEGGITFAQDASAKHDSMPRSAIAAGVVDMILSPAEIAQELARIAMHPYAFAKQQESTKVEEDARAEATAHEDDDSALPSGGHPKGKQSPFPEGEEPAPKADDASENAYKKILLLLRSHSGVDFSLYKSTTIRRRIARRLILTKQETPADYAVFLRGNSGELDSLYSDVLISVTSFFRNSEAFDALQQEVLPHLLKARTDEPLRCWVLGCSTGQEAYSIAIAFMESAEKLKSARKLQIFATDLNEKLLDKARQGLYATTLAEDISPTRLRKFFTEEKGGYRVNKQLREMVVFARQNLISDPPFSRMDLISCRNLLIYFEPTLQKKAMPTFHYALRPGGYLLLGASESVGGYTELFDPVDRKQKIFKKKPGPTPAMHLAREHTTRAPEGRVEFAAIQPAERTRDELSAEREADRITINQFAPPGVVVGEDLQVLQFRGPTGAFLEPPVGRASFNVLKMAREGLMLPLRATIELAKKEGRPTRRENVRIKNNGDTRAINLEVIPLKTSDEPGFLIFFESAESPSRSPRAAQAENKGPKLGKKEEANRIRELEDEVADTRNYFQSAQEQNEATNEELQAANEEIQSANEELQSVNEELETSKEELESANEELTTVNEEMANHNNELNTLNNDLFNFQNVVLVAVFVVELDASIRRFSAQAAQQFNLLATDVGKPISHIRHNYKVVSAAGDESDLDLEAVAMQAAATRNETEYTIRDEDGRWSLLRARPYMTIDNRVNGSVLTLHDVDTLKRSEQVIAHLAAIVECSDDAIIGKNLDGVITSWNEGAHRLYGYTEEEAIGRLVTLLIPEDHADEEPQILARIRRGEVIENYETVRLHKDGTLLNVSLTVSPVKDSEGRVIGAAKIARDITDRKRTDMLLSESEDRFRSLFASAPMAVFVCDRNAVIQDYNVRAAELWGREPRRGIEKHCGSTNLWLTDGTHLPHDQSPIVEVLRTGEPTHNVEVLIERPDGSRLPVIVNFAALKGAKGDVTGAITSFVDIVDLSQAAQALRVSEERYRDLFNSMDEGYCIIQVIFDGNGAPVDYLFEEVNPAFERQAGMHDVVGKRMLEFVSDIEDHWLQNYGNVAMTGEPVRFANEYKGLNRWFEVFAFRVGVPEDRRVAVLFNDITERRRSEMENLQKQKLASMGVLAGGIAHDFNNLLTGILGAGSLIAEMPKLPDEARPLADGIVTACMRAADLTRQILAYAGKGRFIVEAVDLSDQVREVTKLLAATVPKTVRIELDLQGSLPSVMGDRGQLQQVIMNLVLNAAEAGPEGRDAAVSVSTKRAKVSKKEANDDRLVIKAPPGDFVALTVKDQGRGMDAVTQSQIFDPFYSTKASGRGLGLSAVLGIVRGHHGSLRIDSSPAQGSTFTVLFPVSESLVEPVSEEVAITQDAAPKKAADTILVIDDEAVILQVITAALQPTGKTVLTAANGLEGVEAFQRSAGQISTILLDLMMPVMDGQDALKRIRAISPDVRVVAMSGYTERDAIHHFGNDDQITFLQKPFTITELLKILGLPSRRDG